MGGAPLSGAAPGRAAESRVQSLTVSPKPLEQAGRMVRMSAVLLSGGLLAGTAAAEMPGFEVVPDQSPAQLLPPTMVSGTNFHVVDPVHGDGLMYPFVVDSRFGKFEAYGRLALAKRVREVAALTELSGKSDAQIVASGVQYGVESDVKTVLGVVKNPAATITAIPEGIAHLFQGYTAQAEEAAAELHNAASSSESGANRIGDDLKRGDQAARRYAEHYLGITGAERRWYKRLGVDPYTDNTVLRDAIRKAAKTEALGSFGIKFARLPAIPGIAITKRVVDAIYNEDPAAVRQRLRKTLSSYGVSPSEIEAWLNAPFMSPSAQVLLLSAAEALDGVSGRGELFRHSLHLTSDTEALVYLHSAGLLVLAHKTHPLKAILPGVRLPSAELADERLVICGAFEAMYWTEAVAEIEEELQRSLPSQREGVGRELWVAGTISDRASHALQERGWDVHSVPDVPSSEAVPH